MNLYNSLGKHTKRSVPCILLERQTACFPLTSQPIERKVLCLTNLFPSILAVFDWKINKNSCSKAELQVVVGLSLYELLRETSKTD